MNRGKNETKYTHKGNQGEWKHIGLFIPAKFLTTQRKKNDVLEFNYDEEEYEIFVPPSQAAKPNVTTTLQDENQSTPASPTAKHV